MSDRVPSGAERVAGRVPSGAELVRRKMGHLASGGVERERLAPARPEGPSWSTARGSVEPTILRDRTERQQFDTRQQLQATRAP